jgi:hypothetical protein
MSAFQPREAVNVGEKWRRLQVKGKRNISKFALQIRESGYINTRLPV